MPIPLLNYRPSTQNARVEGYEVPGDDQPKIYSAETMTPYSAAMDELIEAAYRQLFFHAFKSDREPFLESQLRNGQITVRDFVRGLLLSETYRNSFYKMNNNYQFVEQTVQRVLGRAPYSEREKLAWSIVVATKGIEGFVDELLDSEEYMENFGYDVLPFQRRRVLPGRNEGELPFNIKSPRYGEYYRSVLGFPQVIWQNGANSFGPQEKEPSAGNPQLYMGMVRDLQNRGVQPPRVAAMNVSMSLVPYRKVDFEVNGPAAS